MTKRVPKLPDPVLGRYDLSVRYSVVGCWGDDARGDYMGNPVYPPYFVRREVDEEWSPEPGVRLHHWEADESWNDRDPAAHQDYPTPAAALRAARRLAGGTRGRGAHPQPPFTSVLGEDTRYTVVPSSSGFGVRRQYLDQGTWTTDPDWYDTDPYADDPWFEDARERTYRTFREAARAAWRHAHLVEGYEG